MSTASKVLVLQVLGKIGVFFTIQQRSGGDTVRVVLCNDKYDCVCNRSVQGDRHWAHRRTYTYTHAHGHAGTHTHKYLQMQLLLTS
jgi:hypothetical protein